jgi:hypothetical protein
MRSAIADALASDAELLASLTGGVYDASEVGEISRQSTPDAFDANGEILPCALVRTESDQLYGPFTSPGSISSRSFVMVYLYQRQGFDTIDVAMGRVLTLLHKQRLGDSTWEICWADDSGDLEDEGLACAMRYARYVAYRLK